MAGFKIQAFRGTAPKLSPELLQDTQAQIAKNCKLYSGDLMAFPQAVVAGSNGVTSTVKTLFAQKNPVNGQLFFYAWNGNVSVATPSFSDINEEKFYYTGDGVPKVSTFNLATTSGSGTAPHPDDWYELGLPLPTTKVTTVAQPFTQKVSASIARDGFGVATMVTATPHELTTGNSISISGFSTRAATITFDATTTNPHVIALPSHGYSSGASLLITFGTPSVPANLPSGYYTITVTGSNTFTIENRQTGTPAAGTAPCDISIADFNSPTVQVTVVNDTTFTYPSSGPPMATLITSAGRTDLGQVPQLRTYVYTWVTPWLEESIPSEPSADLIVKEGQVITISNLPTAKPTVPVKNFIAGIRLYRTYAGVQTGNYFLLKTLWFPQTTSRVSRIGGVSRVKMSIPHNLIVGDRFKLTNCTNSSLNITGGAVSKVVDELTFEYLQAGVNIADTADVSGILYYDVAENNTFPAIYWGDGNIFTFTDNFSTNSLVTTLQSEEYLGPPEDLQGIKAMNGSTLVGFVNNRLFFSEPTKFHAWPIKYEQTLEYDIVAVEPVSSLGVIVLTKGFPYLVSGNDPASITVQRVDAMYPCVSAKSVVSMNYGIAYATHEGIAIFSGTAGPRLVTAALFSKETWRATFPTPANIVATYFNDAYLVSDGSTTLAFYFNEESGGDIVSFDEVFTAGWYDSETNKLYFAKGTAGVVYEWDNTAQPSVPYEWKSKVIITPGFMNFGAAKIEADYDGVNPVTFKMWVNKSLLTTITVTNDGVFRLPTGYKADTFELSVSGVVRLRSIHVADTPFALRQV